MFRKIAILGLVWTLQACQSTPAFWDTVSEVQLDRFLGKWFVIASRPTMFEKNAFNAIENYSLNPSTGKIDVEFLYNKGALDGPLKSMPQTAYVSDLKTNAHWKIGIWFLPFDLDYLIIALDPDYQWTVVGVPNQKYIWVMARDANMSEAKLEEILSLVRLKGYNTKDIQRIQHG
jgi:apolipoprotein D and lipocalin family protein